MEKEREDFISLKNKIIGEQISHGKYKCCLEKPCTYCIEKTPGHGEGATCDCLQDIVEGNHPYEVWVSLDERFCGCNCPYDLGPCKHCAAVFYEIQEANKLPSCKFINILNLDELKKIEINENNILHPLNDNYQVKIWARNLTDEEYASRGFYFGNDPRDGYTAKQYTQLAEPLVFGVTLDYQF